MQTTQESVLISNVIISIGIINVPLALAMGALVGAGLFILNSKKRPPILNVTYFTIAFVIGLFGGQTLGGVLVKMLPFLQVASIDHFTGALVSAALFITLLESALKKIQAKEMEANP